MDDLPQDPLQLLGQLAREYQQKYSELEEVIRTVEPHLIPQHLLVRAELSTDHFRAAQQALLLLMSSESEEDRQQAVRAAVALCRCFDEMRILFQFSIDFATRTPIEGGET